MAQAVRSLITKTNPRHNAAVSPSCDAASSPAARNAQSKMSCATKAFAFCLVPHAEVMQQAGEYLGSSS